MFWLMHSKMKYDVKVSSISAVIAGILMPFILFFMLSNIKLVLIIVAIGFVIFYFTNQSTEGAKIRAWKAQKPQEVTARDFAEAVKANDAVPTSLPYYRMQFFSSGIENIDTDEDFPLLFDAHPNKEETLFREFGYLVTTKGIIYKLAVVNHQTDNENKYDVKTILIPFQNVYRVEKTSDDEVTCFYVNRTNKKFKASENAIDRVIRIIELAVELGWTKVSDARCKSKTSDNEIHQDLDEAVEHAHRMVDSENLKFPESGDLAGLNLSIKSDLSNNQINDRFGGRQGHGHVGEQYGDALDRLKLKNASHSDAQTHDKNGRDRVVSGTNIQTKYCVSAEKSIGQVFDGNQAKYIQDGKMMTVEVPRDQYQDCVDLMAKRIEKGEVPNEHDPKNAANYVKKGAISYEHSRIATKSIFDRKSQIEVRDAKNRVIKNPDGTPQMREVTLGEKLVWSAGGDFMTGVASSLPTAFVTGIWVYCTSVWEGTDKKEALKNTALATLKPALWGGGMYMLSSQFAGSNLGKKVGQQLFSGTGREITGKVTGASMGVLTAVVMVGPDAINCIRGRISMAQLVKNTLVSTAGVGIGFAVGGAIGLIVPVAGVAIGSAVGSVVGGAIGSSGAKKILDHFVEDDAIEMIRIAKEEFIETVLSAALKSDEVESILKITFLSKDFNKQMQIMYAQKNSRAYIHNLYFNDVVDIYKHRQLPSEQELLSVIA